MEKVEHAGRSTRPALQGRPRVTEVTAVAPFSDLGHPRDVVDEEIAEHGTIAH